MNGEMIYPRCVNRLITKQEGRQTIREKSCSFHWHLTLGRSGTGAHKIAIRNCCCSRDSRIQGCLRFSICAAAGIAFDCGRGDLTGVRWACTRRLRTACHRGHVAVVAAAAGAAVVVSEPQPWRKAQIAKLRATNAKATSDLTMAAR